eukprot:TRINITY_DN5436_c0_g1_i1.p1 TRINITY_DN5436_c0_g1~~TRINITY_DN5436_c0_g1_i1.p1  ORF type:complete len:174 (-),score=16.23 TRINITY_DN5436_c0_g1_i1:24-545(-)
MKSRLKYKDPSAPPTSILIGEQDGLDRRKTCSSGMIYGNQVWLEKTEHPTVTHLGIHMPETPRSTMARLGLYQDLDGHPSFLIAETLAVDLKEGKVSIPVENLPVAANRKYWVIFVLSHECVCSFRKSNSVSYFSFLHDFSKSLPPSLNRRGTKKVGIQFNCFVTISCASRPR